MQQTSSKSCFLMAYNLNLFNSISGCYQHRIRHPPWPTSAKQKFPQSHTRCLAHVNINAGTRKKVIISGHLCEISIEFLRGRNVGKRVLRQFAIKPECHEVNANDDFPLIFPRLSRELSVSVSPQRIQIDRGRKKRPLTHVERDGIDMSQGLLFHR